MIHFVSYHTQVLSDQYYFCRRRIFLSLCPRGEGPAAEIRRQSLRVYAAAAASHAHPAAAASRRIARCRRRAGSRVDIAVQISSTRRCRRATGRLPFGNAACLPGGQSVAATSRHPVPPDVVQCLPGAMKRRLTAPSVISNLPAVSAKEKPKTSLSKNTARCAASYMDQSAWKPVPIQPFRRMLRRTGRPSRLAAFARRRSKVSAVSVCGTGRSRSSWRCA